MGTKQNATVVPLQSLDGIEHYADALSALNQARKDCIALAFQQLSAEARLDECKFELQIAALALREGPNASANSTTRTFRTDWIDADAACSRAYDAWAEAKQVEEDAKAQEAAAYADWLAAKARRDVAYTAWQKASETPERLTR
jgi:hypothetical protein